jgi:metallo-beta-lactamase family protein
MYITFYGAAKAVTGSKHLITLRSGKRILLDCGMVQGKYSRKLNKDFLFDPGSVNYLILSHAHLDHSGLVPLLVKNGFKGKIFCTEATRELTELLLMDAAGIMESDGSKNNSILPLYTREDVQKTLLLFEEVAFDNEIQIDKDISLKLTRSGHILGSAVSNLTIRDHHRTRKICYTGDLGRYSNRILYPPQPIPQPDIVICESTYGDSLHQSIESTEAVLENAINEVCRKNGKLLIPAFSIGRTQELLYSLNRMAESGKLENIPVYIDSPMAIYATEIVKKHRESFNDKLQSYLDFDSKPFSFPQLHLIEKEADSEKVRDLDRPVIVISTAGMMDAGRIRKYLKKYLPRLETGLLITGYSAPGTLGDEIGNGAKMVEMDGVEVEVNAELYFLKEYSAHGDFGDILTFLSHADKEKIKKIFLVHGEVPVMRKLKASLDKEGFKQVEIAERDLSYPV